MTINTCPVCGHEKFKLVNGCAQCGWNYPVMLGSGEAVERALKDHLVKTRERWQRHRYQLDSEPELERDPFETWDEFSVRLSSRLWCAGEAVLNKNKYDIEASRFYIELHVNSWIKPLGWKVIQCWLSLNRDEAKALYLKATTWPLYVELELVQQEPRIKRVVLFTGDQEIAVVVRQSYEGRYISLRDGTITDTQTGLMWMSASVGQKWKNGKVIGVAKTMTWEEAYKQNETRFAGYSDWHLPTIEELNSLVYSSTGDRAAFDDEGVGGACVGNFQRPTIDLDAFPNTPASLYWSSSPIPSVSRCMWSVSFGYGRVGYCDKKSGRYHVRLVRGGK